jgi:hypothetical protein
MHRGQGSSSNTKSKRLGGSGGQQHGRSSSSSSSSSSIIDPDVRHLGTDPGGWGGWLTSEFCGCVPGFIIRKTGGRGGVLEKKRGCWWLFVLRIPCPSCFVARGLSRPAANKVCFFPFRFLLNWAIRVVFWCVHVGSGSAAMFQHAVLLPFVESTWCLK